jgi:hypothetical protein
MSDKIALIVIAICVVVVAIIAFSTKNETFEYIEYEYNEDVIESFPTSAQNVLISDTNGNLSVTSDLGLQNLTVASDSNINGNLAVKGNLNQTGTINAAGSINASGNLNVTGTINGNNLGPGIFGGSGKQIKTDVVLAGDGHSGRLHLVGDNIYVMAKGGMRIANDGNSSNPWGAAKGDLTVDNSLTVAGLDVKKALDTLANRVDALEQGVAYKTKFANSCGGGACNQKGSICLPGRPGAGASTWVCDGSAWVAQSTYGT